MLIVESPSLPPGACAVSKSDIGPFFDTNIDFDDLPTFGRLYLCFDTVATMADEMGWLPPEKAQALRDEAAAAVAELEQARAKLAAHEAAVSSLVLAGWTPPEEEMIPDGEADPDGTAPADPAPRAGTRARGKSRTR